MLTLEEIQARLASHPNLSELSRQVGLTRSYLSALALGKRLNPSYDTLKKLSEALNG